MNREKSLLDLLLEACRSDSGVSEYDASASRMHFLTYQEIASRSYDIYSAMKDKGVAAGDLVTFEAGKRLDFICAFWACVMGGFTAFPIRSLQKEVFHDVVFGEHPIHRDKISFSIGEDIGAKKGFLDLQELAAHPSTIRFETLTDAPQFRYLQYTSGSTMGPKAVILTPENLLAQIQSVSERLRISESDRTLSWQPFSHCYGFMIFHLIPLASKIPQHFISDELFMQSPLIWMQFAQQLEATILGAIPFSLEHFINRFQLHAGAERLALDLRSIRGILVGAELITRSLCEEFEEILRPYGLRENALIPLYGLSETVTITTLCEPETPISFSAIHDSELSIGTLMDNSLITGKDATQYAAVGRPLQGVQVQIVDEELQPLPDKMVGKILISGDIVSPGYYGDEAATRRAFTDEGALISGDLGFRNGTQLVVIGREKEMVNAKGKKFACHLLELAAQRVLDTTEFGKVAITNLIAPTTRTEKIIAFLEAEKGVFLSSRCHSATVAVKQAIFRQFGVEIDMVVAVREIPRTFSGKIRRLALVNHYLQHHDDPAFYRKCGLMDGKASDTGAIARDICSVMQTLFQIDRFDPGRTFQDYGVVSVNVPGLIRALSRRFRVALESTAIFNYSTIESMAEHIHQLQRDQQAKTGSEGIGKETGVKSMNQVAIIGMSCRFPGGAKDPEAFWKLLTDGKDGIIPVPSDRWDREKYYDPDSDVPGRVHCDEGGFLEEGIQGFDAGFFNISPKEAMSLDPQQRLLLELTWEAFENSGLNIHRFNGSQTGVYIGMSTDEYALSHLYSGDLSRIDAYSLTGMCKSTACGRISYTFGFEGPSLAVDTACSSSLSALHVARQAIEQGEIDLAVVAGVNAMISPAVNIGFTKLKATSPRGRSKSFDAEADGYGRSEGGGAILLKNLNQALRDGDKIWGIVRATGINQDGKSNGLTAPNGLSQKRLIRDTLDRAALCFEEIDYVEMHGTGTKLGDPIEVEAIMDTYATAHTRDNPLWIGSVKSNIGHLEAGAGMASVIKVLLSLEHQMIPSNLHFHTPNPLIDWRDGRLQVVDRNVSWERRSDRARLAAIDGFGFGGSNAHVVIEEGPAREPLRQGALRLSPILKLSATSEKALRQMVGQKIEELASLDPESLPAYCHRQNKSRADFSFRLAVVGETKDDLQKKLEAYLEQDAVPDLYTGKADGPRMPAFLFTGQGSQYHNMARNLYENSDVFQKTFDTCDRLFKKYLLTSLVRLIYGEETGKEDLNETYLAQPLIFSAEIAVCRLLESLGISPSLVIGHSIGEYAAAVVSGMISLEEAVQLVSMRGRLMHSAPGSGAMMTVFASSKMVEEVIAEYGSALSIAARNSEQITVVSGKKDEIESLEKKLQTRGMSTRQLVVSHAFHSELMRPVVAEFRDFARDIAYRPSQIDFISCMYAGKIHEGEILDENYWSEHILHSVDFYPALMSVENPLDYVWIEVGPSRVLSSLARTILPAEAAVENALYRDRADQKQFALILALAYVHGLTLKWEEIQFSGGEAPYNGSLSNYPYQRNTYWMEPLFDRGNPTHDPTSHSLLGEHIQTPALRQIDLFQRIFTYHDPSFMGEHLIFESAISPAAAHLSMLISAMQELERPASITIENLELHAPLAVSAEQNRKVQFCFEMDSSQNKAFQIYSADEQRCKDWTLHAQGRVRREEKPFETSLKAPDEQEIARLGGNAESVLYDAMRSTGFDLGEGFRCITGFARNGDGGLTRIEPPRASQHREEYVIYPGVVDCLLQSMLCIQYSKFEEEGKQKSEKTIIPYHIGSFKYNYVPVKELYVRVEIQSGEDLLFGSVTGFNEIGHPVVEIKDFMAQFTTRERLLRQVKENRMQMHYEPVWVPTQAEEEHILDEDWLLLDVFSLGKQPVVQQLQTVATHQGFSLTSAPLAESDESDGRPVILFVEAGSVVQPIVETMECMKRLFAFTQRYLRNASAQSRGIFLLVSGGEDARSEMVRAWSRSLAAEYPNLYRGVLVAETGCKPEVILSEIVRSEGEEIKWTRSGERMALRLRPLPSRAKDIQEKRREFQGTYVITGGSGALGMGYAAFLAGQGAERLLLLSRGGVRESTLKEREVIREKGCDIVDLICDLNDLDSCVRALAPYAREVKGIVHAGGVLQDAMMEEMTLEQWNQVLEVKVVGMHHILEALKESPIEFVWLLSSMTSLLGNAGQMNYALANAYLNGFAAEAHDFECSSICWGPFSDGGMAISSEAILENMKRLGIEPLRRDELPMYLGDFLQEPGQIRLIADIGWERFLRQSVSPFVSRLVCELQPDTSVSAQLAEENLRELLSTLPKQKRKEALLGQLQKLSERILGFTGGQSMDIDQSFRTQGADSLMLFSMRNQVNKCLELNLDVSVFYNYATLRELTDYLLETQLIFEPTAEFAADLLDELTALI